MWWWTRCRKTSFAIHTENIIWSYHHPARSSNPGMETPWSFCPYGSQTIRVRAWREYTVYVFIFMISLPYLLSSCEYIYIFCNFNEYMFEWAYFYLSFSWRVSDKRILFNMFSSSGYHQCDSLSLPEIKETGFAYVTYAHWPSYPEFHMRVHADDNFAFRELCAQLATLNETKLRLAAVHPHQIGEDEFDVVLQRRLMWFWRRHTCRAIKGSWCLNVANLKIFISNRFVFCHIRTSSFWEIFTI